MSVVRGVARLHVEPRGELDIREVVEAVVDVGVASEDGHGCRATKSPTLAQEVVGQVKVNHGPCRA
eukprot:4895109-Pyramimonas_sp.AAC.1